jgi:hypothetical protein
VDDQRSIRNLIAEIKLDLIDMRELRVQIAEVAADARWAKRLAGAALVVAASPRFGGPSFPQITAAVLNYLT